MATKAKRATVYFDPALHRALRTKAAQTSRSVSDLVTDAVRGTLQEDHEDLAAFADRADEPLVSYEDMLEQLRGDGVI